MFTHQVWQMRIHEAYIKEETAPAGWLLADGEQLQALAMPTAVKAARKLAQASCPNTSSGV
ncbi:MAG: hypothetical protein Q4C54_06560 [Clostridia bacterium]|nr:hypothetical protein [Clostridia bacterium]